MILARMIPLKQDRSTEFILNRFNSSTCTVRRLPIKNRWTRTTGMFVFASCLTRTTGDKPHVR